MDGTIPLPHDVKDSTQFVAEMRRLRQWSDLSYRELERRAGAVGDVLPRATLAGALNRQELPREELVAAFVRACGGDKAAVEAWVGARKRLAVELGQEQEQGQGQGQDSSEPVEPEGEDAPESPAVPDPVPKEPKRPKRKRLKAAGRRLRRPGVVITATAAIVILTAAATAILHPGDEPDKPRESSRTEAPAATTPSSTKSRPADDATTGAADADAEPANDEPSRGATRETSSPAPSQQTTTPKKPKPSRSSPTPEWTYDPPAVPDDPPPSTDTPPPSGGGDPFPEETCWDVTEEC